VRIRSPHGRPRADSIAADHVPSPLRVNRPAQTFLFSHPHLAPPPALVISLSDGGGLGAIRRDREALSWLRGVEADRGVPGRPAREVGSQVDVSPRCGERAPVFASQGENQEGRRSASRSMHCPGVSLYEGCVVRCRIWESGSGGFGSGGGSGSGPGIGGVGVGGGSGGGNGLGGWGSVVMSLRFPVGGPRKRAPP
jgi:hypothetical protein